MRSLLGFLFLGVFLISCDDGDIIVTTFDFEDATFNMCSDERSKVLYHINNDDVFETLSLQLSSSQFSPEEGELTLTDQPISIELSGNNQIIYRTYDGPVPTGANAYFCGAVPPANPRVIQEYRSVGGRVIIRTDFVFNLIDGALDHDGDGIPSSQEGMENGLDTDGDGILDYMDIDDDGDNVLTSVERRAQGEDPTANGFLDTDEDGIPNYLDTDDDNDGVPTRQEVTAANPDPLANRNEGNTLPRFLDRFDNRPFPGEVEDVRENTIPVRYESFIEAQNLKLRNQGGDGEEISFTSINLGRFQTGEVQIPVEPEEE